MDLAVSPRFRARYPQGLFGALVARGCPNRAAPQALGSSLRAIEARVRERLAGGALDADPVAAAYAAYFRRAGSRYPVAHQARTILAGQPLASASALVTVMFAAEVDTLVLTSGHDLDALAGPLLVDLASPEERYVKLSGKEQVLRPDDMVVRDGAGVIASVLYGPDHRTRLRADSVAALFGAWAPVGLDAATVASHLRGLAALLAVEWPDATAEPPRIVGGGPEAAA